MAESWPVFEKRGKLERIVRVPRTLVGKVEVSERAAVTKRGGITVNSCEFEETED